MTDSIAVKLESNSHNSNTHNNNVINTDTTSSTNTTQHNNNTEQFKHDITSLYNNNNAIITLLLQNKQIIDQYTTDNSTTALSFQYVLRLFQFIQHSITKLYNTVQNNVASTQHTIDTTFTRITEYINPHNTLPKSHTSNNHTKRTNHVLVDEAIKQPKGKPPNTAKKQRIDTHDPQSHPETKHHLYNTQQQYITTLKQRFTVQSIQQLLQQIKHEYNQVYNGSKLSQSLNREQITNLCDALQPLQYNNTFIDWCNTDIENVRDTLLEVINLPTSWDERDKLQPIHVEQINGTRPTVESTLRAAIQQIIVLGKYKVQAFDCTAEYKDKSSPLYDIKKHLRNCISAISPEGANTVFKPNKTHYCLYIVEYDTYVVSAVCFTVLEAVKEDLNRQIDILYMYTVPNYRNKGLSRLLITHLRLIASQVFSAKYIYVSVVNQPDNNTTKNHISAAMRFWQSKYIGFTDDPVNLPSHLQASNITKLSCRLMHSNREAFNRYLAIKLVYSSTDNVNDAIVNTVFTTDENSSYHFTRQINVFTSPKHTVDTTMSTNNVFVINEEYVQQLMLFGRFSAAAIRAVLRDTNNNIELAANMLFSELESYENKDMVVDKSTHLTNNNSTR